MKNYLIKMVLTLLVISGFLSLGEKKNEVYAEAEAINRLVENVAAYTSYDTLVVYDGLTMQELSRKLDNQLNSNLDGYGEYIATLALDQGVDPVVATSIILLETGCKWNCSNLVVSCNNVGGMRGSGCNGYQKFDTLEDGIKGFMSNLSNNYYKKGLNTPELMNRKYATSSTWAYKVNNYVKTIMEN